MGNGRNAIARSIMRWPEFLCLSGIHRLDGKDSYLSSLVQTIDLPATILRQFEIDIPQQNGGIPLQECWEHDEKIRDVALFGLFGGQLNATDGRYVYMKSPVDWDEPIYQYTP